MYNCDHCDIKLNSFFELSRHVQTQNHIRNKMKLELSIDFMKKQVDRIRERPEDFNKLLERCQFRTVSDIEQREEFFEIKNSHQAELCKELIDVLYSEIIQYRIMQMPQEMRAPFRAAISESEHLETIAKDKEPQTEPAAKQ